MSINQISQIVVSHLIHLSSRKNIEVYLFASDDVSEMKRKVPFSQKDKFLIISMFGDVICCDGKSDNFLDALNLHEEKYRLFYQNLL